MQVDQLETERLILRMWQNEDIEHYTKMCADPEVMQHLGGSTFSELEAWRHAAFFIGHWYLKGYSHWAVVEKKSRKFIGRIGFLNPNGWPGFEIGWALSKDVWGKGYATEGALKALDYAFTKLNRKYVISLIDPENTASKKVAMKIGESYQNDTEFKGRIVNVFGIERTEDRKG